MATLTTRCKRTTDCSKARRMGSSLTYLLRPDLVILSLFLVVLVFVYAYRQAGARSEASDWSTRRTTGPTCSDTYHERVRDRLTLTSGAKMPVLGLGTWLSKKGEVRQAVFDAISVGYRHIDTAWIYKNEREVGAGISDAILSGLVTRSDLFITGKLWNTFHRTEEVERAINETLVNLGLAYLDLYLIHWPISMKKGVSLAKGEIAKEDHFDSNISLVETWRAMENLARRGLTKSVGTSNFGQRRLQQLLAFASIPPAVNQIEMHPFLQQNELLDFCRRKRIVVTAYAPLGSPGRDTKPADEPTLMQEEAVRVAADAVSSSLPPGKKQNQGAVTTVGQTLLLWAWHRGLVAIPKALRGVVNGSMHLPLTEFARICSLERGLRYVPGDRMLRPRQTVADLWGETDIT